MLPSQNARSSSGRTAPQRQGKPLTFFGFVNTLAICCLVGGIGYLAFEAGKANLAASIYKDKMVRIAQDYEALRGTFNQAVQRTAVTELVAKGDTLTVRIRTTTGVVKEIATPFKPSSEIYVDFVVLDGRLWIRRVFDASTPPDQGVLIDPALADVEWAKRDPASPITVGKAVYRALGEGRWIVTVTGDGSLGLAKATGEAVLTAAPEVREYSTVESDTAKEAGAITAGDVWKWITR
ncbi:MAG: hypothetical protein KGS45_01395 [Planctomycetes bacterium]|nr:hypothetical protein [Planctomycetota bacterium]